MLLPVPVPVPVSVPVSNLGDHMKQLDHEKLDVYHIALQFLVLASEIAGSLPRGTGRLADELYRAAVSQVLNIAEGAGEFSRGEKRRFYRIARRSTTEAAAVLDACRCLKLVDHSKLDAGRVLLVRIIEMLTKMVQQNDGRERERERERAGLPMLDNPPCRP